MGQCPWVDDDALKTQFAGSLNPFEKLPFKVRLLAFNAKFLGFCPVFALFLEFD